MAKDGGPAYPIPEQRASDGTGISEGWHGMSLRDHFAAHAMTGLLARSALNLMAPDDLSRVALRYADAMLQSRAALRAQGEG